QQAQNCYQGNGRSTSGAISYGKSINVDIDNIDTMLSNVGKANSNQMMRGSRRLKPASHLYLYHLLIGEFCSLGFALIRVPNPMN
ncbi:hypothetical protein P3S34_25830, partial [Enterobacter hormaechei]|uniref:hypothetical protein n=1 Tax=Enterobacter hormaechei TaxID=158836 RepID=UPI0023E37743